MKKQPEKNTIIFCVILAVVWLIAVPIRLIGSDCFELYNLQTHGVETKAHVTLLEPKNHQSVHYTYRVNSVEYKGVGRAGFGNPEFASLSEGMELRAFYIPSSPEVSCLGLPHVLLVNDIVPFVLFLLLVSVVLGYQLRKALKQQPTSA